MSPRGNVYMLDVSHNVCICACVGTRVRTCEISEVIPENSLILPGLDPFSPLYSLILNFNPKLVSLKIFLARLPVFSTIARIHLIRSPIKIR